MFYVNRSNFPWLAVILNITVSPDLRRFACRTLITVRLDLSAIYEDDCHHSWTPKTGYAILQSKCCLKLGKHYRIGEC